MTEFVGSLPTKTPTSSGEALGDVLMCTCIVVITCCSGFVSLRLSMSTDGKRLSPRTSTSIYLFLHGCHNLCFRRNHVTILLHQNLPQSKDVEIRFVIFCLHDRRLHRRRQVFIIIYFLTAHYMSFADRSPMVLLPTYSDLSMSNLNHVLFIHSEILLFS